MVVKGAQYQFTTGMTVRHTQIWQQRLVER